MQSMYSKHEQLTIQFVTIFSFVVSTNVVLFPQLPHAFVAQKNAFIWPILGTSSPLLCSYSTHCKSGITTSLFSVTHLIGNFYFFFSNLKMTYEIAAIMMEMLFLVVSTFIFFQVPSSFISMFKYMTWLYRCTSLTRFWCNNVMGTFVSLEKKNIHYPK